MIKGINNGKYFTKGLKTQYTYLIFMYEIRDRKIENKIRGNQKIVFSIIRSFVSLSIVIMKINCNSETQWCEVRSCYE